MMHGFTSCCKDAADAAVSRCQVFGLVYAARDKHSMVLPIRLRYTQLLRILEVQKQALHLYVDSDKCSRDLLSIVRLLRQPAYAC